MPNIQTSRISHAKASIPELERRVALLPSNCDLVNDLGVAYYDAGRVDDALTAFLRAHALDARSSCEFNIALSLEELGRFEESLGWLDSASTKIGERLLPEDVLLARSHALLRAGRYQEAWPAHERGRWTKLESRLQAGLQEAMPEWQGERIKTPLLILGEGGCGDRLCFTRFLPWVSELGVRYYCAIDHGFQRGTVVLRDMFERLPWVDRSLASGTDFGSVSGSLKFSHWTTTYALMAARRVAVEEIPAAMPWYADPARVARFRLAPDHRPTVGLAWAAGEMLEGDRRVRSMTEWQASHLVAQTADHIRWVNLQHGFHVPSGAVNFPPFGCWDDTAAAVMQCDLVVTVDTGVMHLAAVLGKPIWVVLKGNSDWKFGLSGQCPWYPKARLFRNGAAWGLENALRELSAALRAGEARPYRDQGASMVRGDTKARLRSRLELSSGAKAHMGITKPGRRRQSSPKQRSR